MSAPTAKELQLLPKFRENLKDLKLEGTYKNEDHYLLRWIRAREWDLKKAEEMLRKHLIWRTQELDVDGLLDWDPPLHIIKNYPYELWGTDYEDNPCGMLLFGLWDIKKAVDNGEKIHVQRYFERQFEELEKLTRDLTTKLGKPITQINFIVDMDRLSYRQLISIPTVETILGFAASFEVNHAEVVKSCIIINAPKIFNLLFSMVKPFLSPRTIEKIEIFTHDDKQWKPRLLKSIPADQIPVRYGGTNTTFMDKFKAMNLGSEEENEADFQEIEIDAGEKINIEYELDDPTITMAWAFKTENYDIGFSVLFNGEEVHPYERVDSDKLVSSGQLKCTKSGKYVVCFDNSFSRLRSKSLKYFIEFSN